MLNMLYNEIMTCGGNYVILLMTVPLLFLLPIHRLCIKKIGAQICNFSSKFTHYA